MGLFGFFKKEEPEPGRELFFASSEEFLRGEESDVIWSLVQGLIKFDYDSNKETVVPILEQRWASANCTNTFMVKQVKPYCLFGSEEAYKLNAERLLKILEARGDCPNAVFALAVFYQIGLFTADDNEAEAEIHHNIAAEQESVLENMLRMIPEIKVKPNVMIDENEALIVTLNPLNIKMYYKELSDTLSMSDEKDLLFIYTVGIGWFTSLGYPLSTTFLSAPMLHWKREVAYGQTIYNLFTRETPHQSGEWMLRRLIQAARGGNLYAVNALKNHGIDYRYDYN